jgi:hypothetical protein
MIKFGSVPRGVAEVLTDLPKVIIDTSSGLSSMSHYNNQSKT